jgi:hypothetical protein
MWEPALLTGPDPSVVFAGGGEAEPTIGTSPHLVGVRVILSVVFPEANGANVVPPALSQCEVVAAGAAIWTLRPTLHDGFRVQTAGVCLEPRSSPSDFAWPRRIFTDSGQSEPNCCSIGTLRRNDRSNGLTTEPGDLC